MEACVLSGDSGGDSACDQASPVAPDAAVMEPGTVGTETSPAQSSPFPGKAAGPVVVVAAVSAGRSPRWADLVEEG